MLESLERTAVTLNLPIDLNTISLIDALRARLRALQPIKPNVVSTGAVMENVERGDKVDLFRFPVPRWHEGDGGRYLGTAHLVITRDPETGVENVGCYRVMLQDKDKVGLYISPGKHGRMHYEKAMKTGKSFPVAMVFGQHPLLFIAASQAVPFGVNEYDWTGGILGQPIDVIKGPLTGLHFPASAEIAIEGEIVPGEVLLANGLVITLALAAPSRLCALKPYIIEMTRSFAVPLLSNRQFMACIVPVCAPLQYGTGWSKPACPIFAVFIYRRRRSAL
jgi:4-hydroxy-3-polyprenylbenzoate decarboxylase